MTYEEFTLAWFIGLCGLAGLVCGALLVYAFLKNV